MHKHAHFYILAGLATAGLLAALNPTPASAHNGCGNNFNSGSRPGRGQYMNHWMRQNGQFNANLPANQFLNNQYLGNQFNAALNSNFVQQKQALKAERKRIRDMAKAGLITPAQKAAFDQQLNQSFQRYRQQYQSRYGTAFGGLNSGLLGTSAYNPSFNGYYNPYGNAYLPYGSSNQFDVYDMYNNPGFLGYLSGANPGLLSQLRNFLGI